MNSLIKEEPIPDNEVSDTQGSLLDLKEKSTKDNIMDSKIELEVAQSIEDLEISDSAEQNIGPKLKFSLDRVKELHSLIVESDMKQADRYSQNEIFETVKQIKTLRQCSFENYKQRDIFSAKSSALRHLENLKGINDEKFKVVDRLVKDIFQ